MLAIAALLDDGGPPRPEGGERSNKHEEIDLTTDPDLVFVKLIALAGG
jgi:hypothetical protein